jgi:hypothetical protein
MKESRTLLSQIAHARSGDKGNHANIVVLAYTPAGFRWMQKNLTAEIVQQYFASLNPSRVQRFEAANVLGLNFVLYDVLAGGASRSLRIDSQGKTLGLALLQMEMKPPLRNWNAIRRPVPKGKGKGEVSQDMMSGVETPPNPKPRKKHD